MPRNLSIIIIVASIVLALAILGGLVWANTSYVRAQPVEKDFLIPWLAARTFLQYGDSPYSIPATQRAQIQYYGRLAVENEDPLNLWLPMPVELFYFPFAFISNYVLARGLWMTLLEIALVALAFLSLRLTDWKPARILLPFLLLSPIFWIYGAFSLSSGSGVGFLALALVGFLIALREGQDEAAGMLLLLALFMPRLTCVFVFFIVWWIIYHQRWRIVWGFLMGLVFLLALSFLFLPDWVIPFSHGMLVHFINYPGQSTINIFGTWSPVVGPRLAWVLAGFLLLVLFFEWGNVLRRDFRHLLWTISLTLVATPLLGIPVYILDYVIFFIPLILFLSILDERPSHPWRRGAAAAVFLFVPVVGLWILAILLLAAGALTGLVDILILSMPVTLIIGLYWMRWRFTRLPRPESEAFQ
jgi:hypothetical protein